MCGEWQHVDIGSIWVLGLWLVLVLPCRQRLVSQHNAPCFKCMDARGTDNYSCSSSCSLTFFVSNSSRDLTDICLRIAFPFCFHHNPVTAKCSPPQTNCLILLFFKGSPTPVAPQGPALPTQEQLNFEQRGLTQFMHFSLSTFAPINCTNGTRCVVKEQNCLDANNEVGNS